MLKSLKLFNFLMVTCLLFLCFFLMPKEVIGQSGKVKQEAIKSKKLVLSLVAKNFLRIENPLGNISISSSQSDNITLEASLRNNSNIVNKKDILIEEQNDQVYLKVPITKTTPIDLKILVPPGVNLRLLSESGNIDINLLVGSLVATTKLGNIHLSVNDSINADLSLSSTFGTIKSTKFIKAANSANLKSFHKQLGKGGTIITLYTEQGNITLDTNATSPTPDITFNKIPTNPSSNSSNNPNNSSASNNSNNSEPLLKNTPDNKVIGKKPILRRNDGAENNENAENNDSRPTPSASANSSNNEDDGVIKIESQLVTLNAAALTSSGQSVVNLSQSDFLLYEDGVAQEIVHFQSVNSPFNLVLLIDLSGSVREKLRLIQRSAWAFIQATRPEDKVAIITFSSSTQLICPLTSDRQLLKRKIDDIKDVEGGTNFYDALVGSINWVLRQAKNQRNAIVIMSDGVDNSLPGVPGRGSQTSFNELLDRIQESDTIIFPIYLNTEQEVMEEMGLYIPQAYTISRQQLQTMADTTGGSIFYADRLSDLSGCYEKVAAELRTIYSLGYYPTNGNNDGGFRKIRLKVKKDDVKVKTRRGYYAKNA